MQEAVLMKLTEAGPARSLCSGPTRAEHDVGEPCLTQSNTTDNERSKKHQPRAVMVWKVTEDDHKVPVWVALTK